MVIAHGVSDVQRAIAFARDNKLELAVRSGGHSNAGFSTTEGGLVIDLREMNAIEVDTKTGTLWAEAGATAAQVTAAAVEHGMVVGFGDAGSVGVGGIVTGGGVGYLSRKHGLTIDSVLAAEVVLANGELVTASAADNPDLFWAIRGGGGNFGVVLRVRFKLAALPAFTGGMLLLPATVETIAGFMALAEAGPEGLGTIANVMPAPPMPFLPADAVGKPVIFAMMAYAGPDDEAAAALKPFRELATPLADFVKPGPYTSIYPPEDPGYRPLAVSRTLFSDTIGKAEAETILSMLAQSDAPMRVAQLRALGGAIGRVPAEATAYAHRNSRIMVNVAAFYTGPGDRAQKLDWVERLAAALTQGDTGMYVNFVSNEGPDAVRRAYPGATWDRLRQVKAKYDPQNLFRLNQNIPPA
jgi:FAD/FMN-containing dehydrogenase